MAKTKKPKESEASETDITLYLNAYDTEYVNLRYRLMFGCPGILATIFEASSLARSLFSLIFISICFFA